MESRKKKNFHEAEAPRGEYEFKTGANREESKRISIKKKLWLNAL
jgi:hypothetical protein